MAEGTMTIDVPLSDVITEVIGNGIVAGVPDTVRQTFAKLSEQLAGSGAVATAIEGASAGLVETVTWAELSAIAGTRAGQPGQAIGPDAGTHTDPVVGGTVANKGKYSWSTAPAGWRWIGDYQAVTDEMIDDINAALALKAPLASPGLTGVPTAPTAAPGTDTTQIATAAFVQAALAALVDASPGTLDTLNELAAALGDDPNFATTLTNALALKAPLASPGLTGVPTAPTAAPGTDTTQIATAAFVQAAVDPVSAALDLRVPVIPGRHGYQWGVVSPAGRVAMGLNAAGDLLLKGKQLVKFFTARSGYLWGVASPAGRVVFGFSPSARMIYRGVDVTDVFDAGLPPRVTAIEALMQSSASVVCWGDSLTEGSGSSGGLTYPVQLATLLGRTVTALGRGGQTDQQIAARAGGRASLLTVSGDEIPASGPVSVTNLSISLMSYSGGAWALSGSLAGVPGTLNEDGSGVYTFTRSAAGDAVMCLPGTPFIPATVYPDHIHVIWIGRNNYSGVSDPSALAAVNVMIKECIASIIGTMTTLDRRFIILGVTSRGDNTSEYVGTENYDAKRDLAADLTRDYPKSFIDIDAILRANGDGGGTDNADIANGVLPTSLTAVDRIHLNNDGYAIVAAAVHDRIIQNGW